MSAACLGCLGSLLHEINCESYTRKKKNAGAKRERRGGRKKLRELGGSAAERNKKLRELGGSTAEGSKKVRELGGSALKKAKK